MRHNKPLLLLFLLGLLLMACSGQIGASPTPTPTPTPTPPPPKSGIRVLLVPATGTSTPTQANLSITQALLSQRLTAFGFKQLSIDEQTSGSRPTLQVEVPHFGGDERATLDILLNTGLFEFWATGPEVVAIGSTFTPSQFAQNNPGGKAPFTGTDLDRSQVSVGTDSEGRPVIYFAMKGDAIKRFGQFTQQNINQYLTVTLDRKVVQSAVIEAALTGLAQITGNFTHQYAAAVVSVLKYSSLPVALQTASESSF